MIISTVQVISNIRSEIKIPTMIFSGYEYYYSKYLILIYKQTSKAIIDKIVEI